MKTHANIAEHDAGIEAIRAELLDIVGVGDQASPDNQRRRERYPIYFLMQLLPVEPDGTVLSDEAISVVGKDISMTGICVTHDIPLSQRRIIVAVKRPEAQPLLVEAAVSWTRVNALGLHETGCRFIRKVSM